MLPRVMIALFAAVCAIGTAHAAGLDSAEALGSTTNDQLALFICAVAMLRAQEQQNAQMLAMQAYGQIQGQDQGMFGAGMQGRQGQNQLNVTSDLDAQRMNLQRELANQQAIQNQQAMQYGSDRAAAQRSAVPAWRNENGKSVFASSAQVFGAGGEGYEATDRFLP